MHETIFHVSKLTELYWFLRIERKGKIIHLLKKSSKPIPQKRKRRKIDLFGTYEQFKAAQEETKQEEPESAIAEP